MKKIILLLVISFNIVYSQTDSLDALKYCPLHVGDYFQYEVGKSPLASENGYTKIGIANFEIVGDTILANGKKYFNRISQGMTSHILGTLTTQFLRIDSTTGMVYGNNGSDEEFIIDSLFALINDTAQYFVVKNVSPQNILGIDVETKTYSTVWLSLYDIYSWEISKNFGLTHSYYTDANQMKKYQYELVYAKVDGKEYGVFVDVAYSEEIPSQYKLFQNYPNPFNPTTFISYSIPEISFVQLKVYDILGNEVANLVNEEKRSGNYKIEFDASALTSGVYLYRLQSNNFSQTKKLILLR